MLDGRRRGNAEERRLLLGAIVESLHVRNGRIVAYTAREDRSAEVMGLIDAAIGHRSQQAVNGGFACAEREGFEPDTATYRARIA